MYLNFGFFRWVTGDPLSSHCIQEHRSISVATMIFLGIEWLHAPAYRKIKGPTVAHVIKWTL